MTKVLVIYASMTGSTEMMAEAMCDHIRELGHEADLKSFDFEPLDSVQDMLAYDGILIGSYTWDDDLPFEVEDFYDELDNVNLSGKLIGVFGSCDSFYPVYGAALETIANKVSERGAALYGDKLKIELEPDNKDIETCKQFAEGLLQKIS
ncbi:flavodoxin domain-containing protein [Virgibacillus ihumii]|uniref:flavodoxin domain-containing protein n=1 Tax=Virgibacillus ihumii TaxID=2686091 RepID=UPI00157DE385|nr:flavodoxin domain-containing protein [Virgibacillus ihumii]